MHTFEWHLLLALWAFAIAVQAIVSAGDQDTFSSSTDVIDQNDTATGFLLDVATFGTGTPGSGENAECEYDEMNYLPEKLILVGVVGTISAIVGIGLNCLAAFLLGRMMLATSPALIYLFTLSILDVLFLISYLLVCSVQIYFDCFKSALLYFAWNRYLTFVFPIGKILQTASTYLIGMTNIQLARGSKIFALWNRNCSQNLFESECRR